MLSFYVYTVTFAFVVIQYACGAHTSKAYADTAIPVRNMMGAITPIDHFIDVFLL